MKNTTPSDIRSLRLAKRLAQKELADLAEVNVRDLSRWERGLAKPSHEGFVRLASVLGCSCSELEAAQQRYNDSVTPGEGYTTVRSEEMLVLPREAKPNNGYTHVLDLFSGCGGFSFGFEQSGYFAVTGGIDLLGDRIETFGTNHPYATSVVGDIRKFSIKELGGVALHPEVIVGGPPCQGFSSIRPYRTLTEGDPRNSLLEEFVLVIASLQPKWFIFENVVGLLTHKRGVPFRALLQGFEQAGYQTDWRVMNAALFGVPQNRERLVVVGSRDRENFDWPTPTHFSEHRSMAGKHAKRIHVDPLFLPNLRPALTIMDAIHDLPALEASEFSSEYRPDVEPTEYERRMRNGSNELTLHDATAHSVKMLEIIRSAGTNRNMLPEGATSSGFSSCYSRLDPDRPSVTLTVNFVHPASNKCIHPYQDRALTPREGARIQGFPDTFRFHGTRAQIVKQIGNAVPPLLGEVLAKALANAMGIKRQKHLHRSSAA